MAITVSVTPGVAAKVTQIPPGQEHLIAASIPRKTQRFGVTVTGDAKNLGVKWDIAQGGGQINAVGEFFPPTYAGQSTIIVSSIADPGAHATAVISYDGH